ncbi:MAG: single-stranded DNA-binding protein [Stenotrophomonas sp.]
MNSLNAIGRVGGKDAVTRYTQAGEPVTGWSMAVDSGFGDKKQTIWIDCSAWGKRFEKVADYITKGVQLGVTGELGTREHEGKTYITLRVADVTLVGGKQEGGGQQAQRPARQQQAPANPVEDFESDSIPF